jgi:hypothetical protein
MHSCTVGDESLLQRAHEPCSQLQAPVVPHKATGAAGIRRPPFRFSCPFTQPRVLHVILVLKETWSMHIRDHHHIYGKRKRGKRTVYRRIAYLHGHTCSPIQSCMPLWCPSQHNWIARSTRNARESGPTLLTSSPSVSGSGGRSDTETPCMEWWACQSG